MDEVTERISNGVVNYKGDILPEANYIDGNGEFTNRAIEDDDAVEAVVPTGTTEEHEAEDAAAILAVARAAYDRILAAQETWDEYCDRLDTNAPSHEHAYVQTVNKLGARPEMTADLQELFNPTPPKPKTYARKVIETYAADLLASRIAAINATTTLSEAQKRAQISELRAQAIDRQEKKD